MRLLLMRHSQAEAGRDDDPDRALTEEGRLALSSLDGRLQNELSAVSVVLSSPWRRARETAELLLPSTKCSGAPRCVAELLPSAAPASILPLLEAEHSKTILAVGHQPLVGRLGALLCDGGNAQFWAFAPADIAVIDLDWPAVGLGYLRHWYCWQS